MMMKWWWWKLFKNAKLYGLSSRDHARDNLFAQNIQNQAQVNVDFVFKISSQKKSFRAQNVDFFDFQLDSFYELENMIQIERDVYYRNFYLFIKRIKNAIVMIESNAIKMDIFNCLKSLAQIWYIENLNDLEKEVFKTLNNDVDRWCEALIKKFKKFVTFVFNYLTIEENTLDDVQKQRDIFNFVFQIMKHAKAVNIANLHDQLTWIYNVITSKLTRNVNFSNENSIIMIFLKQLKIEKITWYRIYFRKYQSRVEYDQEFENTQAFQSKRLFSFDQFSTF
jgi:hypothetical protein